MPGTVRRETANPGSSPAPGSPAKPGGNDLRVAVVGAGHMGRAHARVLDGIPGARLVAVCDTDPARGRELAGKYAVPWVPGHRELFGVIDAAHICVPTDRHYRISCELIEAGVSLLIEKPITGTVAEGQSLVKMAREKKVPLQVGHIERFNPAARKLASELREPRYLDIDRLGPFKNRGIEVSVVTDLMIHDIDLLLDLVPSPVRDVISIGGAAFTTLPDIATARIVFENGVVANLTASRISDKSLRKIRVFEKDCYWSLDCEHRQLVCYRKNPSDSWKEKAKPELSDLIIRNDVEVEKTDPLEAEIGSFLRVVREGGEPEVTGEDGLRALYLAEKIEQSIAESNS